MSTMLYEDALLVPFERDKWMPVYGGLEAEPKFSAAKFMEACLAYRRVRDN
jgi:hypothetical protein